MPSAIQVPAPPSVSHDDEMDDDDKTVDMEVEAATEASNTAPAANMINSNDIMKKALAVESFGSSSKPVVATEHAKPAEAATAASISAEATEEEVQVPESSTSTAAASDKVSNNKKPAKKVTPSDTPKKSSKKVQQKKSSQMTIFNFLSASNSNKNSALSPLPKSSGKPAVAVSKTTKVATKKSGNNEEETKAAAAKQSSSSAVTQETTTAPMDDTGSLVEMVEVPGQEMSSSNPTPTPPSEEETATLDNDASTKKGDESSKVDDASSNNKDDMEVEETSAPNEDVSKAGESMVGEEKAAAGKDGADVDVIDLSAGDDDNSTKEKAAVSITTTAASLTKKPTMKKAVAPKKKAATKKAPPAPKPLIPIEELPEDRQQLFAKYDGMEARYIVRAQELAEGARGGGLEEEQFERPELQKEELDATAELDHTTVTTNIVMLVEGSSLQLSKLAIMVSEKLAEAHGKTWSTDDITSKIKLLAERKSHLEPNFKEPASQEAVDIFENDTEDRMWRWEVISIDILPSNVVSKIRKARSARNKLRQHQAATLRLVASVQKAIPLIRDPSCPKNKLDTAVAKLSKDEEKVLKYEREAEKQKLAKQAKRQKELEAEAKRLEKEEAAEEKRREKERKQQEAEQKKLEHERQKKEAAEAREEAKKKKAQLQKEKEEQQKAAEKRKEESLKKQASCLMSFFGACKSSSPKKRVEDTDMAGATSVAEAKTDTSSSDGDFDAEKFRSSINSKEKHDSGPIFGKLSPQAIASRKRRTRQVSVSVYVTVMPDNAFDAQPFAEQQIIQIPNKYRFLSFHEDCRPAYHGTWSKKSSIVSGRNPLGKDTDVLDYEYDSEFEWEEGDDDIGEDVNDDGKDQEEDMDDEEGDIKNYNYQDGWMVDDDDLLEGNEDMDEETRELYKKKLLSGQARSDMLTPNTVCVVAPVMGGIPVEDFQSGISSGVVEGFSAKEAEGVVASHAAIRLHKDDLYLDAFPPPLVVEESNAGGEAAPSSADGSKNSLGKDEYSPEDMETLVRFAHHCTLNSKEKLIEELRTANPSRFESRAKAIRKLDSIAVKQKRRNTTGYFWEVKKDILEELGLTDLLAMKMEGEDKESAEEKAAASKKKKDTTTGAKSTKKRKSNSGDNAKKPATKKAKVETSTDTSARAEQESTKKSTGTGSNSLAKNATPSKKRAAPAGSVNLMESFVKKLKPTPVKTSEEARLNSEASTEAREKESGPSEAVETQSS